MNLHSIKTQLENLGYHCNLRNDELIVGKNNGPDTGSQLILLDNFCTLVINENQIELEYGQAHVPVVEIFATSGPAIAFIKQEFPL